MFTILVAALLILLPLNGVETQECKMPAVFRDTRWYENLIQSWEYTYNEDETQTKITYYSLLSGSYQLMCSGSYTPNGTATPELYFTFVFFADTKTCAWSILSENIVLVLRTDIDLTSTSVENDCATQFTKECYEVGDCTARLQMKGNETNAGTTAGASANAVSFSPSKTTCPFAAGSYWLSIRNGDAVIDCPGQVVIRNDLILIPPCYGNLTTERTSYIYNGTYFSCHGDLFAPSDVIETDGLTTTKFTGLIANSLADDRNLAMFCARHQPANDGAKYNVTIDVSASQFALCGPINSEYSQFISLVFSEIVTTTAEPTTTGSTAESSTSVPTSTSSSSSPVPTTPTSPTTTTTPVEGDCSDYECPESYVCDYDEFGDPECVCPDNYEIVNGVCIWRPTNPDTLTGLIVGITVGCAAAVIAAIVGILLCGAAAGAAGAGAAGAAGGAGLLGAAGVIDKTEPVQAVAYPYATATRRDEVYMEIREPSRNLSPPSPPPSTTLEYPNSARMTIRNTPAYAAMPNDTYVMINSSIPSS